MKMPDIETIKNDELIKNAISNLSEKIGKVDARETISFEAFLGIVVKNPEIPIRNVDQVFYDALKHYMGEGKNEDPDDPETINFMEYDTDSMFVERADFPYFMDMLFANRIMRLANTMKSAQQNKIYIFRGPPGCGKSTFLNELLAKNQEYWNSDKGTRYENVWRFPRSQLKNLDHSDYPVLRKLEQLLNNNSDQPQHECHFNPEDYASENADCTDADYSRQYNNDYVEVPCPSHDNPILMIPKPERREFFDDLFKNDEFKWRLSTEKEYEWVFRDEPCTICSSLYEALLEQLGSAKKVLKFLYARPYKVNRRLGQGISVFNPGDKPLRQNVLSNPVLQKQINSFLRDSNRAKYIFSQYAKTNNGIYALMDVKSHNTERLIELHNITSENVHKVEDIEENVNSMLIAVMNPEDEKNIEGFQSFLDRVEYITIPYVMDLATETKIYRNIFGEHIDEKFLPRVLHNFSRVIISSRLNPKSDAMLEWIRDPDKYMLYCDENLQLLKMEIYTGHIPVWLKEEDRKALTAKRRRKIIDEAEKEGEHGISGRDSIKIFNKLFSEYTKKDKLINMADLIKFFENTPREVKDLIPGGFLDSLLRMYDYTILQEVKECLFYYNPDQICKDIQNYMFAINFEPGATEKCTYTGEKLNITDEFFKAIENKLLGSSANDEERLKYRETASKEYTSMTLTQEIQVQGIPITETELYKRLLDQYEYNLKEKVLDPFLENENFRRAIKDYFTEDFKTYDKRIRNDVKYMIDNLCEKHKYTEKGAREVCMYVIDSDLAKKYTRV